MLVVVLDCADKVRRQKTELSKLIFSEGSDAAIRQWRVESKRRESDEGTGPRFARADGAELLSEDSAAGGMLALLGDGHDVRSDPQRSQAIADALNHYQRPPPRREAANRCSNREFRTSPETHAEDCQRGPGDRTVANLHLHN